MKLNQVEDSKEEELEVPDDLSIAE